MLKNKTKQINSQKGASLYFSLVILSILLATVFGLSSILLGQMRIVQSMGNSVIALYAADTGAERALYEGKTAIPPGPFSETLTNGASYIANIISTTSPECNGQYYCIESIGKYEGVQRRVFITR